ncbi:MAG: hypothetical protein JSR31_05920 [Nitrospira sp.]|nr:hypothetical protein [Nitrospira sp.]
MSLLLAGRSSTPNAVDFVATATGQVDVLGVLILAVPVQLDLVGIGTGIAAVWGVMVDGNEAGMAAASGVRLMYHDEPPNRFWPRTSLKPY